MNVRPSGEKGVSPVVAVTVLVAIVVVLSALTLVTVSDVTSPSDTPAAGVSVDYQSESVISTQLNSIQRADAVYVKTALGTEYKYEEVGDTVEILNIEGEEQMTVIASIDGQRTVLQQIEPHSFDPTYTVGENGDFETVQAAVQEATSDGDTGEIIAVKRGTYSVDNLALKNITLIGETGTTIVDSGDTTSSTVTVANNTTLSNVQVVANGSENAIETTDNARLSNVTVAETSNDSPVQLKNTSTSVDLVSLSTATSVTTGTDLLASPKTDAGSGTENTPSDSLTETTTSINKRFDSGSSQTVASGDIQSANLTVKFNQPTQYFGLSLDFNNETGRIYDVTKRNRGGEMFYWVNGNHHKIPNAAENPSKVRLVYKSNTMKVYHDGSLVGSPEIDDFTEIVYDPDDNAQWMEINGTVTKVNQTQ